MLKWHEKKIKVLNVMGVSAVIQLHHLNYILVMSVKSDDLVCVILRLIFLHKSG